MRSLLLVPAVLIVLIVPSASASADPLVCADLGGVEIEDVVTIDPPEICLL